MIYFTFLQTDVVYNLIVHYCWLYLTGEADIVASHVEKLVSYGLKQQDIAVIAPYNLQVT